MSIELQVNLVEQGAVTLDSPPRYLFVSPPGRVLDQKIVGMAGSRSRGSPYHLVVDQVGLHDLGAFAGNGVRGFLGRSRGDVDAGRQPKERGHSRDSATVVPICRRDESDVTGTLPQLGQACGRRIEAA